MTAKMRRRLRLEEDPNHDSLVTFDINEYLIENFSLTATQRKSVWTLCQNDPEFDWTLVEDQIDDVVYQLAEDDPSIELPEYEEVTEEDAEESAEPDYDGCLILDVFDYILQQYPKVSDDQAIEIVDHMNSDESFDLGPIYDYFDFYVNAYASEIDDTLDLTQHEEEEEEEDDDDEYDNNNTDDKLE